MSTLHSAAVDGYDSGVLDAPAAVLFDLDGVLIDSYRVWFQLLNAAAEHWHLPGIDEETFASSWGQGVEADRTSFYPDRSIAEIEAFYHAHFGDHLAHLVIPPGVEEVFSALAARSLPSAVITNTPNPLATELVERAGATPDLVLGGTDVPRAKPAPDLVRHAAKALAVDVTRCWVVGDSSFDRDAARAAGSAFVGIGIEGDRSLARLEEVAALLPS